MSEEIGLIYINTSRLLDDICVFLRDDITKESFSAELKKKAETLIKRSKIQLQQISVITNGECYMEMEEQKKVEDEEEEEEEELIYMDAEEEKEIPVGRNFVCPYSGLPAKDLHLNDKYGYISLKTKFIFGFEKLKRLFAAIHDDWFLMYCNEKDSKPCYTYWLRVHRARIIATTKQSEEETSLFGLINLDTEQMLQFIAQTHKDMLQWITRINRYHENDHRQLYKMEDPPKIETVPAEIQVENQADVEEEEEEHYDMVIVKENVDIKCIETPEEDEIYEVIRPESPHASQHIPIPKPSDISTMPTKRKLTPLPPLPVERQPSSDSLVSYDNPLITDTWPKPPDILETNSFSDEDDQEIYDVLATSPYPEQETLPGKQSTYPSESPKEEVISPTISSIKEKLLQSHPKNEKPIPPKKLVFDKEPSSGMFDSITKENKPPERIQLKATSPVKLPVGNKVLTASPDDTPSFPNGRGASVKRSPPPKPSILTKPKIDVKIIKASPNSKSTKQVMKLAKEISLK